MVTTEDILKITSGVSASLAAFFWDRHRRSVRQHGGPTNGRRATLEERVNQVIIHQARMQTQLDAIQEDQSQQYVATESIRAMLKAIQVSIAVIRQDQGEARNK